MKPFLEENSLNREDFPFVEDGTIIDPEVNVESASIECTLHQAKQTLSLSSHPPMLMYLSLLCLSTDPS